MPSGTTASTSPPTTSSSRLTPWPTRTPAAPTPEPSSTRSNHGASIDDDTFEVVAKEPLYTFLYDIVAFIVPKHIWESVPFAEWRNDPGATGADPSRVIGSGPFKFQEWRQGESVTLVRNDDYYGKVPYIDSYVAPRLARSDGCRQRAPQRRNRRRSARAVRHRRRRRHTRDPGGALSHPRLHSITSSISIPR